MSNSAIRIERFENIPQWDQFVQEHPKGSVMHSTTMIRCQEATPDHYPFAYGAINSSGQLCAILVAVRIATLSVLHAQVASRSILYGEPIFIDTAEGREGIDALIARHDLFMSSRALFAEVRPIFDHNQSYDPLLAAGYTKSGYLNYELNLCCCPKELFQRLGQKRRNNVRCAERKGVEVRLADDKSGLDLFYSLVSASYSRSKLPLVDKSIFVQAVARYPDNVFRIYTAYYQNQPVASGCFLAFKDRVICWYAGTLRIPGIPAMTSVFWHAIKSFASEGYELFDFAGGGWIGQSYGPGKFKSKFGSHVTNHGRYRKVYAPWKLKVATAIYDRMREYIAPKGESSPVAK